jgi:hypothetical protein
LRCGGRKGERRGLVWYNVTLRKKQRGVTKEGVVGFIFFYFLVNNPPSSHDANVTELQGSVEVRRQKM